MRDSTIRSRLRRRFLLLAPAALSASLLRAQTTAKEPTYKPEPSPLQGEIPVKSTDDKTEVRLVNGKKQMDEILKADYQKNLQDARDLTGLARSLEEDLEKDEAFVFSLTSLKKLDDMEKLTKRIRGRMKRL